MTNWYVKDFSKLTGVSVQTLHYYDRINLLKPSLRMHNGYRLYSERDLIKLQKIIALKFFGFNLSQIKKLLFGDESILDNFSKQVNFLEKKVESLQFAAEKLKKIVSDVSDEVSIPWKTIIKSIEIYSMTEALENTWAKDVLDANELEQFAKYEREKKIRFEKNPESKNAFLEKRSALLAKVKEHLEEDPTSEKAIRLGKDWMTLINSLYGPEHANLKFAIWEKGYKQEKVGGERFLEPEVVQWLDKAIEAYYQGRFKSILDVIKEGEEPSKQLTQEWKSLMAEICGDSKEMKAQFYKDLMQHEKISQVGKQWLKQFV